MIDANNSYTVMQKAFYESEATNMAIENHRGHDANPDYYGLLLSDIIQEPDRWVGTNALDFGCGAGRNIDNLLRLVKWNSVSGCDIAQANIENARRLLDAKGHRDFRLYVTLGVGLDSVLKEHRDFYDFVMSTLVLQHIAVWEIRHVIFQDILQAMRPGGLFSFQMAMNGPARYDENAWGARNTNGGYDVGVSRVADLRDELLSIGFRDFRYWIRREWDYSAQQYAADSNWVFVKTCK